MSSFLFLFSSPILWTLLYHGATVSFDSVDSWRSSCYCLFCFVVVAVHSFSGVRQKLTCMLSWLNAYSCMREWTCLLCLSCICPWNTTGRLCARHRLCCMGRSGGSLRRGRLRMNRSAHVIVKCCGLCFFMLVFCVLLEGVCSVIIVFYDSHVSWTILSGALFYFSFVRPHHSFGASFIHYLAFMTVLCFAFCLWLPSSFLSQCSSICNSRIFVAIFFFVLCCHIPVVWISNLI